MWTESILTKWKIVCHSTQCRVKLMRQLSIFAFDERKAEPISIGSKKTQYYWCSIDKQRYYPSVITAFALFVFNDTSITTVVSNLSI